LAANPIIARVVSAAAAASIILASHQRSHPVDSISLINAIKPVLARATLNGFLPPTVHTVIQLL